MSEDETLTAQSNAQSGWVPPPWEPPVAGSEVEAILGALDRQRATFRWKADGLDSDGLRTTIGASTVTLGGLLKHLAAVEDYTTTVKLSGEWDGEPWRSMGHDMSNDWEFRTSLEDSPETLYALWAEAVGRSRERVAAALERGGLDQEVAIDDGDGHHANLRRLLLDLLEEYGRHTGHADLLREAVDGRVGEDPDEDWTGWPL